MAVSSMTVADNAEEKFLLDVTVEEAAELIADNPDIVILDVRTPREFKRSHIENAINIDYHSFSFKSKIRKLDRDKTYLIHCQSGVRSGKTIPLLRVLRALTRFITWALECGPGKKLDYLAYNWIGFLNRLVINANGSRRVF